MQRVEEGAQEGNVNGGSMYTGSAGIARMYYEILVALDGAPESFFGGTFSQFT